jgi:NDP-sugar pyrophosphorylase family protein
MKAMILAAGLGTRLRPLTNDRPKALVELCGKTLLEITLTRLASFGVRDFIINVHHHAEVVVDFLKKNHDFGLRIEISREDVLLDTGGGLKQAAWFFLEKRDEPNCDFLLHNVDVLSTVDLRKMIEFHKKQQALATLAVQDRETSRRLLFDEEGQLCGRQVGDGSTKIVRQGRSPHSLAFCGIHVISARFLTMMSEDGVFSIIDSYLRLAAQGETIAGFRADDYYWRDVGKPNDLSKAAEDMEHGYLRA